jgi:hypothetical protein
MEPRTLRRVCFVLVLLCATIAAQTPSAAFEHGHPHSAQHCCGLCHTGPLPFLHCPVADRVAPDVQMGWLASPEELDFAHELLISAGTSRAPPA